MFIFQKLITLLFCNIAIVNTVRWFSATDIEKSWNLQKSKVIDDYLSEYGGEDNDVKEPALISIKQNESKFKRNEPKATNTTKIDDLKKRVHTATPLTSDLIFIRVNNTIEAQEFIKKRKPKQKDHHKRYLETTTINSKHAPMSPAPRFLEVFQVIEIKHEACTSSTGLEGTCLPEYKCKETKGFNMGTCADGFGTCCVYLLKCNDHSALKMGWFNNPEFPSPNNDHIVCSVTLEKYSKDVVQIRLDFNVFELQPPRDGVCKEDRFFIAGQNSNDALPILCGINTGQHMYIEVGDVTGPITLTIQTATAETRAFSIKVAQLTSADDLKAPTGCMQYYKRDQGYLESFNYRDKSEFILERVPSYLNNLNYAMCIERSPDMCSITYINTGILQIPNYDGEGLPVIPPDQAGVEILNCPGDWLLIAAIRLCGERLNDGSILVDFAANAPVTDYSMGPIVVWFRSDEAHVGYGFKLLYQQNPCISQ